jgi:hypothetical protein
MRVALKGSTEANVEVLQQDASAAILPCKLAARQRSTGDLMMEVL